MTRARFVHGCEQLRQRFDAVREAVICAPRDRAALRAEIVAMREKMRHARPIAPGQFDLKHSPGGMIDIEFATQYLVLAHAGEHRQLIRNAGNTALLRMAEDAGLLPAGLGYAAADSYRAMRRSQHTARLDECPATLALEQAQALQQAGRQLWEAVFGSAQPECS